MVLAVFTRAGLVDALVGADRKRYPAVDPVESYSKYLEYPELEEWFGENMGGDWVGSVKELKNVVALSREANEQISILGDDSVPMDYHNTFWRGELVDFTLMQQDAFDQVDSFCSLERQGFMMRQIRSICRSNFEFKKYDEIAPWYKRVINCIKQMNYTVYDSLQFRKFQEELEQILVERRKA